MNEKMTIELGTLVSVLHEVFKGKFNEFIELAQEIADGEMENTQVLDCCFFSMTAIEWGVINGLEDRPKITQEVLNDFRERIFNGMESVVGEEYAEMIEKLYFLKQEQYRAAAAEGGENISNSIGRTFCENLNEDCYGKSWYVPFVIIAGNQFLSLASKTEKVIKNELFSE